MANRTFSASGTIPEGWFVMTLSETMTGAQAGDWYCCLRRQAGEATSCYGITPQEAFDGAARKAIAWNQAHG